MIKLSQIKFDGIVLDAFANEKINKKTRCLPTQLSHLVNHLSTYSPFINRLICAEIDWLTSVIDNGQGASGQIPGYSVAGKTGTAQTYLKGKPLEGPGTTFATFVGFLPASDPEIVILTKIDKPRTSQWASSTALPLFKKVAEYLVGYLSISPDR